MGTDDFTIEFFFKSNNSTNRNYSTVIAANIDNANTGFWKLEMNINSSGTIVWEDRGNTRITATNTNWYNDQWHHLALTREGTSVKLFLDGTQIGSTATYSYTYAGTSVVFGSRRLGSDVWNGNMSNLRIIKGTALYTSNFTPPTKQLTDITNTVLLTCQGNTISDASSGGHTLTASGTAAANLGFPASAFEFDGTNDYIDLGDTFDDIISGADKKFTIESWVNPDSVSGNKTIVSKYGDSNFSENTRQFQLRIDGDEVKIYVWFGQSGDRRDYATSSANLTAGSWHHIVLVYDGSIDAAGRFTFYVNGQNEAATETYSSGSWGDIQDTTSRFAIGAVVGANVANSPLSPFDGKISNTKIYSRLLTAAEVTQNYNATKGRYA